MGLRTATLRRDGPPSADPPEGEAPLRRCIASGLRWPKDRMLRFVVGPDGGLVTDVAGTLPGRGIWLSANRDMVNKACEKNLFAKAARSRISVPVGLAAEVERLLARRCLDLVGLARRAGQLTAGFERVKERLRAGNDGVLLTAADGAPNGRAKIRALGRHLALVEVFSGAELGAAIGRAEAVHLVVTPGSIADKLVAEAARLAGFRVPNHGSAGEN